MKILKNLLVITISLITILSCDIEDGVNLNGPTTDSVSEDLSRSELIQTTAGVLADMRTGLATQVDAQSVAGREYWRASSSDPRWTGDLLTGILDNNTFYTTTPYSARYANVKNINLILTGLDNTTADFSSEEIAAATGFLNTIKAHELLMVLNQQFQNGIRFDVSDPNNLGPFLDYDSSLTAIFDMLTAAAMDLSNGGGAFPFNLTSGFSGFTTPANFLLFTNALTARVEAYRGNYTAVNTLLQNSFMDMAGDLATGIYFTYSLNGADVANPLFYSLNSTIANVRLAHPSFITDAEAGDTRLSKVVFREKLNEDTGLIEPNPLKIDDGDDDDLAATADDLIGTHDVFIYDSNVASVPVIRNEELILLSAEANHIVNPAAAVTAINVIRVAAGLPAYTGGTTPAELVDEILNQRRYSLYGEGHRWIDARRFGILGDLPLDRVIHDTFEQFPTPANENQ